MRDLNHSARDLASNWGEACDRLNEALSNASDAISDLREIQEECKTWIDELQETITTLEKIGEVDLDGLGQSIDDAEGNVDREPSELLRLLEE